MDALGREHVRAHGIDQWHQHRRRGADPIGKRREVELDPIVGLGPAYLHTQGTCSDSRTDTETQNGSVAIKNMAFGPPSVDACHRPCWRPHDGSRSHERNNTFIHSHPRRPPGRARVWPFTYVVVGDSLAALCPWKWSFGLSPVAVANLAVSGSDIRGMIHQIDLADQFRPQVILLSGGLNDLISYEAPLDAIRHDFALLLRHLRKEQKSVVTLMPYISDPNFADRITAANEVIAEMSLQRGIPVVDINSSLSVDGVRRPEMTTDGIHLSALACRTWIAAVKSRLAALNWPAPNKGKSR
jgi:lysophospholipase L1-like esterase